MSADKAGKSSMFSALGGAAAAEAQRGAASDPAASAAALQPLQERIDALEARLAEAQNNAPVDRIAALEKQLKETQEKAIASMLVLREREEAQKTAQRESEMMLKSLAAQRRTEEVDRQLRDQLANQRRRIDDLESRLVESATAAGGAQQLEPVIAAQRMAAGQLSAYEGDLRALAERVDDLKKTGEASASALNALRAGLDLLRIDLESRFAAGDASAGATAAAIAALESGLVRTRTELEAQAGHQRDVSASTVAALRGALEELKNSTLSIVSAGDPAAASSESALAKSLSGMEATLRAGDEGRMLAMKAEMAGLWKECASVLRAVQAGAAETSALESRLRSLMSAESSERKAAVESLGAGLGDRIESREGRWESRLAALRAEFVSYAARWDAGAAETREKTAANTQLAAALDYALRTLKAEAVSLEALKRVEGELSILQTEAGSWAQTRAFQGDLMSRIEQVRTAFDEKLRASSGSIAAFETEVRGLILARVLRLEERISNKES